MRILYVSTGSKTHDARLLAELVKQGHEVCYAPLTPGRDVATAASVRTTQLGYEDSVRGSWLHRMLSFSLSYVRGYLRLRRLVRVYQPDVLHATFVQTAGLLSALTGFHPLLLSPWGSDVLRYPRDSAIMKLMTIYVVGSSDVIFCDSHSVRRTLGELTGCPIDKIPVIPWGVNLAVFRRDTATREKTRRDLGWESNKIIITTRNFHPVYGVSYLLESLPSVFLSEPTARALLIGTGPLEPSLRSLVQKLGIKGRVRFLGEVPNDEIPKYLNAADLYVSSSLSDGTSVSLLEAMACGLPVVVTDVEANLEWVRNGINGLVVPRANSRSLGDAITALLVDGHSREAMSLRNRVEVGERANWDANFSRIQALYRSVVRRALSEVAGRSR